MARSTYRSSSRLARLGYLALLAALALSLGAAGSAQAGVANAGIAGAPSSDPLAGLPWGVYTGAIDNVYPAYQHASGTDRQLLAKIALRPLMFWFGAWYPDDQAQQGAAQYIATQTSGNPGVLAQVAVFRLDPWEQQACKQLPSAAQQASYRQWIANFAAGIGSSRVALVLQPDLPVALCAPQHSQISLQLVSYAAKIFSALPHTTVYIDAGAGDWASVSNVVSLLTRAGISSARGFALNATHYDSTSNELRYGARVSKALAAAGASGKHFVINTAENGAPFIFYKYHGNRNNPAVCASTHSRTCATLGIPPTSDVANTRWHLPNWARAIATRDCDAYLWIGRPWLNNGAWPFELQRALGLARSTPF